MVSERILIVDGQPAISRMTSKMLQDRYDVLSVSNPLEALRFIKDSHFDLVLSDYDMPEMQRTEFIAAIQKLSPSTACLFMSGNENLIQAPPNSIPLIKKPLASKELHDAIEKALASSRQLRATPASKRAKTAGLIKQTQVIRGERKETLCDSAEIRSASRKIRDLTIGYIDLDSILCEFCLSETPLSRQTCSQCGKPARQHVIVRDGQNFGIVVEGEVRLHGLTLKGAQRLVSILNDILF